MKRFLCLFTALALLAALGLTAAGLTLSGAGDDVILTEELLYGSPAAVSDVTVTAQTQYDRRLLWTTTYPMGRPEDAVTEFLCRPEGSPQEYEQDWNLDISAGVNGSASGRFESLDNLPANYPKLLFAAVAERTAPGETREETLNLRDYYDVYPLDIYHPLAFTRVQEKAVNQAFTDYLSLPIPAVQNVKIYLTMSPDGDPIRIECDTSDVPFYLEVQSVQTEDAVYFTLTQTPPDSNLDLLPDRLHGVHCIDLTRNEEYGADFFAPDTLRRVYPMDASAGQSRQLTLSEDGKRLFLVTESEAGATLSVLDRATMEQLQTLPLSTGSEATLACLRQEPGFLIAIRADGAFDVMTEDADGALGIRLSGNLLEHTSLEWLGYSDLALHYDGKRLITGFFGYSPTSSSSYENSYESCAVTVMVHDATGLLYAARYHSSIDRACRRSEDYYMAGVSPMGSGSEGLTFQSG